MKSAICPKCFAQTTEEKWVYACRQDHCNSKDEPVSLTGTAKGRGGAPACPGCGEVYASPLCPSCGFPVHGGEPGAASLSVSLVGAQGCGKSCFLAVLIDALKNHVAETYGCALFPLGGDDTTALYDRQYYQPLFVRGQTPGQTGQDEINPLIYSLVFQQERPVKTIDLTFYDSCGANFESTSAMANLARNVYHSGGIIFMIEPTQLPAAAEQEAARGGKVCGIDAVSLLTRTIELIRAGNGQKNLRQKIDIPIAVCITKLDTLRPMLDAGSFLLAPSRHFMADSFDKLDFDACNAEAQSIIEAWGGGEIIRQVMSQFSSFAFFGFSSLGEAPTATGGIQRLTPHRAADPLLWLLAKSGVIGMN